MALPPRPYNPYTRIPNDPFYSPDSNYIRGEYGPFIVGSGISINYTTGVISAGGGGGGGSGTVTSVATGPGLTGGTITSSGTISLAPTTVMPGTYTYATVRVDAYGRVTMASSGANPVASVTGTAPIRVTGTTARVVSIDAASTTGAGAVQLYDGVNSNSDTLALTAAQGKNLQDQINALTVASNLTLAGTFDAATGDMLTVTNDGVTAGFVAGDPLPAPDASNNNHFVIVTTPGTYDPPGPSGPFTLTDGDWLLSDGTQWNLLDVGPTLPYASTTTPGSVCLSTNALAQAGTDTTTALTPAAARSAFVPYACYPAVGDLIGGSMTACAPVTLPIGTAGQILTVDSTSPTGFAWKSPASNGTVTCVDTGVGLTGGPIQTSGVIALTNTGVIAGSYTNPSFTVDAQGRITAVTSGTSGIPCACITGKGTLITGTAASTPVALPPGTDGYVLVTDSTCTTGLKWMAPSSGPIATPTRFGTVVGCTSGNTISLGENALLAGAACFNSNIGIGYEALKGVTTGYKNVAIGANALKVTVSGADNIAIGPNTLSKLTTGYGNVAIGNTVGCSVTGSVNNVYIGNLTACANDGSGNVALGTAAMIRATSGVRNVSIGENSMLNQVSGECVTAVGWNALCGSSSGNTNTALGALAGSNLTTGSQNVAIGYNTHIPNPSGNAQLAIGFDSTQWWLTGCSDRSIKPGAGIRDCNNQPGNCGQVLMSTGANSLVWGNEVQRSCISAFFFPNNSTTNVSLAPNTNNGCASMFWVRALKTSTGEAQIRTGTWIRDFGDNRLDIPWSNGNGGLFSIDNPGSGVAGIRIRNNSGGNLEVVTKWIPIN